MDLGDPSFKCAFCKANFWFDERVDRRYKTCRNPKFSMCCMQGKVNIPLMEDPPLIMKELLYGDSEMSKNFVDNIRMYNMMFSFTSMGGKIDHGINDGRGPPVFRLFGQNCHKIGTLLPVEGSAPQFAQLYIVDTTNEVKNRKKAVGDDLRNSRLDDNIVSKLKDMLDIHNNLVKHFRSVREKMLQENTVNVKLKLIGRRGTDDRRYDMPIVDEIAGLIVGDFDTEPGYRDIIIEPRGRSLQRISEVHPLYLPLQYPLLFIYGQDGYRDDFPLVGTSSGSNSGRNKISIREFFAFRLQERDDESPHILFSRRLLQQFLVDAYTMVESSRLYYIRSHQKELRCELYNRLQEALLRGETDAAAQGSRVYLPPTFTGGPRWMIQNYQDAMAVCRWAGYPNLFITFTCNPKWPEIDRFVDKRGLKAEDRPDIICRVFKMKLDLLMKDLRGGSVFGAVRSVMYTIEFQKRGLPHAHILLWLEKYTSHPNGDDIDKVISAEIPDKLSDPDYYAAVRDFMMHGPCGILRSNSPCMSDGQCTKHFPKGFTETTVVADDGYPIYRRRDNGCSVKKNGVDLDNRYVVPHSRYLLLKYGAHINVEWCNQSRSIKYLFKYVHKGNDRITAAFYQTADDDGSSGCVDEIKMYYDCRYLSACEATWRLFSFDIHFRDTPVERLSFHLPDEQRIYFSGEDHIETVMNRPAVKHSMFVAWMEANKKFPDARELTYAEFPMKFVWDSRKREWHPRQRGFSIGRIYYVPPGKGELYYLRTLLTIVRGPTSYDDIKCVNGVIHETFRDACYTLGLLDDDKEYVDGIIEASHWGSAQSLRSLYATLLVSDSLSRPECVWMKCWEYMSDDILYRRRSSMGNQGLELTVEQIQNYTLLEIENILRSRGRSLRDYPSMPFPSVVDDSLSCNRFICDELAYDRASLSAEHLRFVGFLTDEQRVVYDTIMASVHSGKGGVFFLYGYGGTGKTFVWKTLSAALRSRGDIVLNVASSGIASLLLPSGRTAHSRFAIPLSPDENSTCNIKQGSPLAELILRTKLIIWDEAPMMNKYCFEALDRSMRDILRFNNPNSLEEPFGGKTIVFGGDFRQILPVVPKGTRQDIVRATINSSYLWQHCKVLRLTKNMRLQQTVNIDDSIHIKAFSDWMSSIGDGTTDGDNDGKTEVEMPDDLLIDSTGDPVRSIVESTFPSFSGNVCDPSYLQGRAILAPRNDDVDGVNEYMVSMVHTDERTYLSADVVCRTEGTGTLFENIHSTEFLNNIRCSGIPNHELKLKVGVPVMLLRNVDHTQGLCNGTRLIITRLGNHVLEGQILSGNNTGHKFFIPRMSLSPSDSRIPVRFQRRQFPLNVSYAMTINKSQGQSLSHVGLLLKRPVFTHGQLYVAISRVTSRSGLKMLISDKDGNSTNSTTNVVYKEVFQNL